MNRLLFLLSIALLSKLQVFAQKPQFWQTMQQSLFEWNKVQCSFQQQYRFEMSDFKTQDARFGLLLKRSLNKTWDGEVHYIWINSRHPDETIFQRRHRIELELNPRFSLSKALELRFRNRYELIKEESEPKLIQKFRQRQELVYDPKLDWMKTLSISNEVFYNISINKVDEYRLIPLEAAFPIEKKHSYKLYAMIRWRDSSTGWNPQFVLGSTLNW